MLERRDNGRDQSINSLVLVVTLLQNQLVVCGHVADRGNLMLLQIDGERNRG